MVKPKTMWYRQYGRERQLLGALLERPRAETREPVDPLERTTMFAYDTPTETSTESEHAPVVESEPHWKGPFAEYDRYGELTGAGYVRCSACNVEVIAGETRHATHREGCDRDSE